jgi:hypothetical protein
MHAFTKQRNRQVVGSRPTGGWSGFGHYLLAFCCVDSGSTSMRMGFVAHHESLQRAASSGTKKVGRREAMKEGQKRGPQVEG